MDNKKVILYIVNWIKDYVSSSNYDIKSLVVGVSGGIDSALTSILCAKTGIQTIAIKIPLKTKDLTLSKGHCDFLISNYDNVKVHQVDLTETFDKFHESCMSIGFTNDLGFANSKSRLRMMLLYQAASSYSGIVVGTGNKVEDFGVGFYTKYGDGGVDISPIADLTKSDVRSLAKDLGVSDDILKSPPTDGLWDDDRTDEQQLGLSYEDLEDAMSNENSIHRKKYLDIRKRNIHKMKAIPVCIIKDKN
ncbi:MAG: NAD(+) synthase [Gammaproteobacteria bacterium]|nr:NAD(+) synthase [Gammaproteobacteria bacterium]MBT4654376.1 NAD(+) synthase [Gammaproteobacteria bacterium]MBT5117304.1 NAD(+) synthase [Gammaproteobacteria bacterium]MDG2159162.1 NAD(+) synthase [Gammaproteobacteria bacterium]